MKRCGDRWWRDNGKTADNGSHDSGVRAGETGHPRAPDCQSRKDLFKKLGLQDAVSAIGILTITPSEASIIACDIATKSGAVEIGFLDRFTGAVVLTGDVSAVEYALKQVTRTLGEMMQFTTCSITRT